MAHEGTVPGKLTFGARPRKAKLAARAREGYAVFNYDPATDRFTPTADPASCGHTCHVAVKAKNYVFHPYQKR